MTGWAYKFVLRLDPRVKLVWLLSSMGAFFADSPTVVGIFLVVALLGLLIAYFHSGIYRMALIYLVVVCGAVYLFAIWDLGLDRGIQQATMFSLRLAAIGLAAIDFFALTRPFELMSGLQGFRVPRSITVSLGIGFRFLPIVLQEGRQILLAQRARGLYTGRGFARLVRMPAIVYYTALPVLLIMLRRLNEVLVALYLRGVSGNWEVPEPFAWSLGNVSVVAYSVVMLALSFSL